MEALVRQCEDLLDLYFSQICAMPLISPDNKKLAVPSLHLVRRKQDRLYADPILLVDITHEDLLSEFSLNGQCIGNIITRTASEGLVGAAALAESHTHCLYVIAPGVFSVVPVKKSKSGNFVLLSRELYKLDPSLWKNMYDFVASCEINEP